MAEGTAGAAQPNAAQAEAWNGDEGRHFAAERERHERMGERHAARLLEAAGISAADTALDIGCGCGHTTLQAARLASRGHALGVDLSAVMLAEARRLARQEGIGNARFEQADAQTHPFPAGGFDVTISSFGVMFFDNPSAAFANIAAALRPGGRLAFTCWQEMSRNDWLTVPFAAVAAHATLPGLPAADEPGPFALADPQKIRRLLASAGFGHTGIEALEEDRWIGTGIDDVIGYYTSMPLARPLLANADKHTTTAVLQALRDALHAYQRPEGVVLRSAAWLVTARR